MKHQHTGYKHYILSTSPPHNHHITTTQPPHSWVYFAMDWSKTILFCKSIHCASPPPGFAGEGCLCTHLPPALSLEAFSSSSISLSSSGNSRWLVDISSSVWSCFSSKYFCFVSVFWYMWSKAGKVRWGYSLWALFHNQGGSATPPV